METNPAPRTPPAAPRDLDRHLADVLASPRDGGPLLAIVRRPDRDEREAVAEGQLDVHAGLIGDGWLSRGSSSRPDGSADPESQLTLMSTRVLAAIEPDTSRWPLAGDQLLVDMDLGAENLPVGTRLRVGDAELEVSPKPHTGCAKFAPGSAPMRSAGSARRRAGRPGCVACT